MASVSSKAFENRTDINSVEFGETCNAIEEYAFAGCISLVEMKGVDNIETIGNNAFQQTAIEEVAFNKVETIEEGTFKECSSLVCVNTPNCTKIEKEAFFECGKLKDIDISQCKIIEECAFSGCKSLSRITLYDCESIEKDAFVNCDNLSKVYITKSNGVIELKDKNAFCELYDNSDSVTKIDYNINENTYFYIKSNVISDYIANENWSYYKDYIIAIPESNQIRYITSDKNNIDIKYSFISNEYYKNDSNNGYGLIEFENEVKTLSQMFRGSDKLVSIELPYSCEHIIDLAFENCTNLIDIELDNIKRIDDFAFKGCTGLDSFYIPDSVETLGDGIFAGCDIEKFEGKFTTYDGKAVVYNDKLICASTNIKGGENGEINISEIGENIKRLGKYCFNNCKDITKVNIPSNILSISNNTFDGCTNLKEVYFEGKYPPVIGIDVFKGVNKEDFKIYVPAYYFNSYITMWENSEYVDYIIQI
jgi:hypothetical protein